MPQAGFSRDGVWLAEPPASRNGYFVKPLSPLALANHFRSALKDDAGAAPGAA